MMNTNNKNSSASVMGDEVQMLRKKIEVETNVNISFNLTIEIQLPLIEDQ